MDPNLMRGEFEQSLAGSVWEKLDASSVLAEDSDLVTGGSTLLEFRDLSFISKIFLAEENLATWEEVRRMLTLFLKYLAPDPRPSSV